MQLVCAAYISQTISRKRQSQVVNWSEKEISVTVAGILVLGIIL